MEAESSVGAGPSNSVPGAEAMPTLAVPPASSFEGAASTSAETLPAVAPSAQTALAPVPASVLAPGPIPASGSGLASSSTQAQTIAGRAQIQLPSQSHTVAPTGGSLAPVPPQTQRWHPPQPNMHSLPVDTSKTEPKPAYYKLQFGDDYTGFSYYVRTLEVVIGRKCEKPISDPPPDITSPQIPSRPPLPADTAGAADGGEVEVKAQLGGAPIGDAGPDGGKRVREVAAEGTAATGGEAGVTLEEDVLDRDFNAKILDTPPMTSFDTPPLPPEGSELKPGEPGPTGVREGADNAAVLGLETEAKSGSTVSGPRASPAADAHHRPEDDSDLAKTSQAAAVEPVPVAAIHSAPATLESGPDPAAAGEADKPSAQQIRSPRPTAASVPIMTPRLPIIDDADIPTDPAVIDALLDGPPPPPPPPPEASSAEHVDVDLGPLKSVSRNHARIEFRADLGHFCLEILGRNGAWVDDRYYVKGSSVPLQQGSVIQIATRIFSFILPPSPGDSPSNYLDSSFDSNTPLSDVPYPYNLPASQLGYQEFFADPSASSGTGGAVQEYQVPLPFNAFTAADGSHGLGLGMDRSWDDGYHRPSRHRSHSKWEAYGEGWGEGESEDDSEGDSWDSWDESDEMEDIRRGRRRRGRRRSEGEEGLSELGSDEGDDDDDEDEEEEEGDGVGSGDDEEEDGDAEVDEDDDDEEDSDSSDESEDEEEEVVQPPRKGRKPGPKPKPKNTPTKRRESVASTVVKTEQVDDESDRRGTAGKGTGKGPGLGKGRLPAKSIKAVKAAKSRALKKAGMDVDEDGAAGDDEDAVDAEAEGKKSGKGRGKGQGIKQENEPGSDERPKPAKKMTKKAIRAAEAAAAAAGTTTPSSAAAAGVRAGMTVRPTPNGHIHPGARPPIGTASAAPGANAVRPRPPPATLAAAGLTTQPLVRPGTASNAVRPGMTGPAGPRPPAGAPGQAVPRPPLTASAAGTARPPNLARPPVPTPGGAQPFTPIRPPSIPATSAAAIAAGTATSTSSPGGTPEPPRPFFLTELVETPGRPGHIVVNVPIPPSGAGPRPPPGPLIGLDGQPFIGPSPIKPSATFAVIIYTALAKLPRGRGTLGEVCNWIAGEWEWFRLHIDSGWQNSIRHNLSLNKAFLKVPRITDDDPESKGSVWIIDPVEGPLFEEKARKDAAKDTKAKGSEKVNLKERKVDIPTKINPPVLAPTLKSQQQAAKAAAAAQAAAQAQAQTQAQAGQTGQTGLVGQSKATGAASGIPPAKAAAIAASAPAAGVSGAGTGVKPGAAVTPAKPGAPATLASAAAAATAGAAAGKQATTTGTPASGGNSTGTSSAPIPPAPRSAPAKPAPPPAPPPAPAAPKEKPKHTLPKAKDAVKFVLGSLTPAFRSRSLISAKDSNGNPFPFDCDGKTMILEPSAFGHLTSDIFDKLTTLGAASAFDVLENWVNGKNKQQAAKAAAAAAAGAGTRQGASATKPRPTAGVGPGAGSAGGGAGIAGGAGRGRANGLVSGAGRGRGTGRGGITHAATARSGAAGSGVGKGAVAGAGASSGGGGAGGGAGAIGPAPPGSAMTTIIGMIAQVAAAKGDVNTVGAHAGALLEYIKVVGPAIQVGVAERIWATGILPASLPTPGSMAVAGAGAASKSPNGAVGGAKSALPPVPAQTAKTAPNPGSSTQPPSSRLAIPASTAAPTTNLASASVTATASGLPGLKGSAAAAPPLAPAVGQSAAGSSGPVPNGVSPRPTAPIPTPAANKVSPVVNGVNTPTTLASSAPAASAPTSGGKGPGSTPVAQGLAPVNASSSAPASAQPLAAATLDRPPTGVVAAPAAGAKRKLEDVEVAPPAAPAAGVSADGEVKKQKLEA